MTALMKRLETAIQKSDIRRMRLFGEADFNITNKHTAIRNGRLVHRKEENESYYN